MNQSAVILSAGESTNQAHVMISIEWAPYIILALTIVVVGLILIWRSMDGKERLSLLQIILGKAVRVPADDGASSKGSDVTRGAVADLTATVVERSSKRRGALARLISTAVGILSAAIGGYVARTPEIRYLQENIKRTNQVLDATEKSFRNPASGDRTTAADTGSPQDH